MNVETRATSPCCHITESIRFGRTLGGRRDNGAQGFLNTVTISDCGKNHFRQKSLPYIKICFSAGYYLKPIVAALTGAPSGTSEFAGRTQVYVEQSVALHSQASLPPATWAPPHFRISFSCRQPGLAPGRDHLPGQVPAVRSFPLSRTPQHRPLWLVAASLPLKPSTVLPASLCFLSFGKAHGPFSQDALITNCREMH